MSMRKVVYAASLSLDGYIEATTGDPSWVFPDEELHTHFNDLEKDIDTHLYGRHMYELMAAYWPTADKNPSAPLYELDYARIWKSVPKVVFSKTLETVRWNSRLVKGAAEEEVAKLKAQAGKNMSVGGLRLASALAKAGLIDEYRLYFVPILLGSGTAAFAELGQRVPLCPIETRTFKSGTVLIRCVPALSYHCCIQAA
jgi:dihydrofolate reductase